MFDEIIFEKIQVRRNCSVIFRKHTIFKSEIIVGNYTFSYEFDEDNIKQIADILDAFYGVIKDKLITGAEREQIKQYNALQIILRNIIGD